MTLGPDAEITSLTLDGTALPVPRDGENLIVPVHPGDQSIEVAWRSAEDINTVAQAAPIALPVDGANITTIITVPDSRWVLWAEGPRRGPAVRFWSVLAVALLSALALGSTSLSPLRRFEWVLLGIGLTQINVAAALIVVVWLFLLAWRGRQDPGSMSQLHFNQLQVALVILTLASLAILMFVASKGLLGQPEMFIIGNNSTRTSLEWFLPRRGGICPNRMSCRFRSGITGSPCWPGLFGWPRPSCDGLPGAGYNLRVAALGSRQPVLDSHRQPCPKMYREPCGLDGVHAGDAS